MHIFSVILYALGANIDCLPIAIAYGINKTTISIKSNMMISLISTIGTFLAMIIGLKIKHYIPIYIANLLGCALLCVLGMYFIFDFYRLKDKDTNKVLTKTNIKTREILFLSLTLAINNIVLAIGASITGLPILITSIFSFISSFLFIALGQKIGNSIFANLLKSYSSIVSGGLLIVLAIYEMFI